MSLVYKALSTIEAAERVRRAYPAGTDAVVARRRARRRRSRIVPVFAVLSGVAVLAMVATSPRSFMPQLAGVIGAGDLALGTARKVLTGDASTVAAAVPAPKASTVEASAGGGDAASTKASGTVLEQSKSPPAPAAGDSKSAAASSSGGSEQAVSRAPAPLRVVERDRGRNVIPGETDSRAAVKPRLSTRGQGTGAPSAKVDTAASGPAAPSHGTTRPGLQLKASGSANYVFQPAAATHGRRASTATTADRVSLASADGETSATDQAGRPARQEAGTDGARSQPASRAGAGAFSSDDGNAGGHGQDFLSVTANHTQRIRMLNADLNRAIQDRDKQEIDRVLDQIQALVGSDSTYMLKMRAFSTLAVDGDPHYAIDLLRRVLARDPDDRDAAVNMAVAEIDLGQRAKAKRRLQALVSAHPGDVQIEQLLQSLQ